MACTVQVAWDKRLADYHFELGHPLAPVHIGLTMRLAQWSRCWFFGEKGSIDGG